MKKMLSLLLLTALLLSLKTSYGQEFKLDINISNSSDTIFYIAHYLGNRTYLDDTIYCQKAGKINFTCDTMPPAGMYILANQSMKKLFDFFIDTADHHIALETDADHYVTAMNVEASPTNMDFFSYITLLSQAREESNLLQAEIDSLKTVDNPKQLAKKEKVLNAIDKKVKKEIAELKAQPNNNIFFRFIRAQDVPIIPEDLSSEEQINYFRAHYFDALPLDDAALLRTPIYQEKLSYYTEHLVAKHPDSLLKYCIPLIEASKSNKETYQLTTWFVTNSAERSNIMGMDAAFVALVERYFITGEMDYWLPESAKKDIVEKAQKMSRLLIGIPAPNLIMMDTSKQLRAIAEIQNRYTIVLFWDTDCGHCRKEIPHLRELYTELSDSLDFEVFAICADSSMKKLRDAIKKYEMPWITVSGPRSFTKSYHSLYDINTTPTLYLLDEKKRILAKNILSDQMIEVIKMDRIERQEEK